MARLEATVPDPRAEQYFELADALGVSRSQLIDEALSLYLTIVREYRQGRRLVSMARQEDAPAREISTPTLSALEWALTSEKLTLPQSALARMSELVKDPPKPNEKLRRAARKHRR